LALHIKTFHYGLKEFICEFKGCKKVFSEKANLFVHERMHNGVKPYQCKHCQKTFTARGNMEDHQRRHIGKK
jgi:uncharacterized Zn-finger protein